MTVYMYNFVNVCCMIGWEIDCFHVKPAAVPHVFNS